MKKLLIVESPSKIKTISKFLGKDYVIMSTLGHIKDLPKKELGIHLNNIIELDYTVIEKKDKVISDIVKQAKNSDVIYLAPDPDREGEIIAWHVEQEILKNSKTKKKLQDNIHRIYFNEITKTAIENAIKNPGDVDLDKVAAQQARRVLDRWVGYEVSPILWRKLAKGLSAGRVQSVALKLIANREKEIRLFKPEEYWTVDGLFKYNIDKFSASLTHKNNKKIDLKTEVKTKETVKDIKKQQYIIESIKDTKRLNNPNPPFMTSTLQQAAYNKLGFSVQRTMQTAQKLYEGLPLKDASTPVALITYMRTDSLRVSDIALKQAREYIKSNFTKDYLPPKALVYSKAKKVKKTASSDVAAQDAHEAIRPIEVNVTPEQVKNYIDSDAAKLYELIWKRFLASQMKPAQYAQRKVKIIGGIYTFSVTGSTLLFDGYLKLYEESSSKKEKDKIVLPKDLKEKEPVELEKIDSKQHFTQPPPRFTEATLVKEMEKEGIGRPSTYAATLKTIQKRDYTQLDTKKRFIPTELGMVVTDMLEEHFPKIMDTAFTAKMEQDLDQIAQGQLDRDKLLKEFYTDFEKDLTKFKGEDGRRQSEATEISCPECKEDVLLIRFGKAGAFLGCNRYPECSFTSNFQREESGEIKLVEPEKPEVLEKTCPKCNEPLRKIQGRFGPFVACSGYPKCKYIDPVKAGFKCITCNEGDIVQRVGKGKKFWGCTSYPDCKFTIAGLIKESPCPDCKLPFLLERTDAAGDKIYLCSDKKCGYKEQ